jgi:exodeoxyribonuclease VII small subunit
MAKQSDISKLSFEQAIKQLTDIVEKIEQGEISLQDSLGQYERGMALIKHCREILQQAEKRIDKIAKEQVSEERGQGTENAGQESEPQP